MYRRYDSYDFNERSIYIRSDPTGFLAIIKNWENKVGLENSLKDDELYLGVIAMTFQTKRLKTASNTKGNLPKMCLGTIHHEKESNKKKKKKYCYLPFSSFLFLTSKAQLITGFVLFVLFVLSCIDSWNN